MLKPIPITRSIYQNHKYSFQFFTYAPAALEGASKYIINSNPILFFGIVVKAYSQYSQEQLASKRFRITPKNIYTTLEYFNDLVKWFYDEKKKDLFLIGNDNNLIFNNDYASLKLLTKKGYFENDQMKAFPAVVSDSSGQPAEGVHLFINTPENQVDITLEELEHIVGLLSNFDFYAETILGIEAIKYSMMLNNGQVPAYIPEPKKHFGFQ